MCNISLNVSIMHQSFATTSPEGRGYGGIAGLLSTVILPSRCSGNAVDMPGF